jgi:HSP20 family molecular chaperone IbpA
MRNFLRPFLIGLAGFFLGMAVLFTYLKYGTPDGGGGLVAGSQPEHKPIPSAIQLHKEDEEDAQAQRPPQPGARVQNVPRGIPPGIFDKDDEDFFNAQDPFTVIRKMQDEARQQMAQGFSGFDIEAQGGKITEKEDAKSLSYEISGVDGGSLNTKVEDGYLTISGNAKRQRAGFSVTSSFQRSFSLPPTVDPTKMQTISEKDKVVLRFPKRGA